MSKYPSGGTWCAAASCRSNANANKDLSFFRFPKEEERCMIWAKNCGREDLLKIPPDQCYKKYRLCSKHFTNEMFWNDTHSKLLPVAIPTIYIPKSENIYVLDYVDKSSSSEKAMAAADPLNVAEDIAEPAGGKTPQFHSRTSADYLVIVDDAEKSNSSSEKAVVAGNSLNITQDITEPTGTCTETTPQIHATASPNYFAILVPTPAPVISSADTPKKKCSRKKIQLPQQNRQKTSDSSTKETMSYEDFVAACNIYLSSNTSRLLKVQAFLNKFKSHGTRYPEHFKQFALQIYFLGPKVYKILEQSLYLPPKKMLERMTHQWNVHVGMNDSVFSILKLKISNLSNANKECILCMEEISLKANLFYNITRDEIIGFHHTDTKIAEPANNAIALMVRGMHNEWTQPLGYFFCKTSCAAEELLHIIFYYLKNLYDIGLKVLALTSDQGSNFMKVAKHLNINPEKPYFMMNDKKIIFLYDTLHLFKSLRDNMFKHKLLIGNQEIKKHYIEEFYKRDKTLKIRLAPKLTDAHLNPTNFQKVKVQYATEIFSKAVAAGMSSYVAFGALPAAATVTIEFIDLVNKLFDVLNSSSHKNENKYSDPFNGNAFQIEFLEKSCKYLKNIKVVDTNGKDITSRTKCLNGIQVTINGLLSLWKILQETGAVQLYTSRLNQIENFFGFVRQRGGKPTPIQFSRAFKKLFFKNYLDSSEGQNCLDFDTLLSRFAPEGELIKTNLIDIPSVENSAIIVDVTDYREMQLPEQNSLVHFCGYLIWKCLLKHTCPQCKEYSQANETKNIQTFENLKIPHDNFISYVQIMEHIFISNFKKICSENIGFQLKSLLTCVECPHPCPHFPKEYMLHLFIRVRLFYSLKFINKNFLGVPNCQKVINVLHL